MLLGAPAPPSPPLVPEFALPAAKAPPPPAPDGELGVAVPPAKP